MVRACVLLLVFLTGVSKVLAQSDLVFACKPIAELELRHHLGLLSRPAREAANTYNVVYHRCSWNIDPAVKFIEGNILTHFKPYSLPFSSIEFDLDSALVVDSVIYHSNAISFSHSFDDILTITLPSAITAKVQDSISVFYHGVPAATGNRAFVQSQHAGVPIVWTLSEPFGAKEWWPCKQNLADKIDSLDIYVTVPNGNKVASNGVLVDEIITGTKTLYHWKSKYAIAPYLVAIAATNYSAYSQYVNQKSGGLQILNYLYPENYTEALANVKVTADIIHVFDSLLIDYPFSKEKYGHAQCGLGGGMEHQTMSFMGGFYPSLIAHECAHQWFGDYVTCGSWEDIWLNEGMASYFEWLITMRYDKDGFTSGLPNVIKAITAEPGGSVMCDDTLNTSRIFDNRLSYAKGAFVLRMLSYVLSEDVFYRALRNYLSDTALVANYARTPQLIKHFEAASNRNLDTFFAQWYYGQGYPTYNLNWLQDGASLSFTVSQLQSHPSVKFFEMPLSIQLIGTNVDTTIVLNNTKNGEVFNISCAFRINSLRFDPKHYLLTGSNTVAGYNVLDLVPAALQLFPNPATNEITIGELNDATEIRSLQVLNTLGQVELETQPTIENRQLKVNVSALNSGLHFVVLHAKAFTKVLGFLKKD